LRGIKIKDVHGSGKAAFPGEKKITDESPRMEDGFSDSSFFQEECRVMDKRKEDTARCCSLTPTKKINVKVCN
jgi:hypothetical protein